MKSPIILSALVWLLALSPAARADVSVKVPTSVSGGTGAVTDIQADDGITYDVARNGTLNVGGFEAVGGDISSVVLHVKFSVQAGGYSGNEAIKINGVPTPIVPASGDTNRTESIELNDVNFKVNTWPEITALVVSFKNNDGGSGQSVLFDHIYLVINHTTPLFAPPTWSDEFDDSGPPNPSFWTFEQGFVRNEELQWYQPDNAWQEGGNLIVEGRREQVPNPNYVEGSTDWKKSRQYAQYTSSSIISRNKYSFQYGRLQVRAKIPCFTGSWPAIWTLGDNGEWPSCGECDIMEYYQVDSILSNCARGTTTRWNAWWDAVKKPVSNFTTFQPNWRNEYHVWTMQWDDQNVRLYVDNHLMNTTAQSSLVNPVTTWGPKEPFKQPHHILLNLAIGSNGGNPANTTFPLRYLVDYVRVWEGLTANNAPTDIALSANTVQEGMTAGFVVGNLTATDVDAAEVHSYSLVTGTGSTHNASFEIVPLSDDTRSSNLRTKAVLNRADGAMRSIRIRVTDIEQVTYDKVFTINVGSNTYSVAYNGNGSTGGSVPVDATNYPVGTSVTVLENTGSLVKTGYIFAGWNTAADGSGTNYSPGDTLIISSNTVLHAQWVDAGILAVTPTGSLSPSGNYGGPFSPTTIEYTLTNIGTASLDWTAGKTSSWLSLSETSGTLAPGAITTVTVSLDSEAFTLDAGNYIDTITFTTTNTGSYGSTTRDASLLVSGPGPVSHFLITGIPSQTVVGTPITGITITAQDSSNETATSFTGTVTFGGTAGITGTSASFVDGVITGASITPMLVGEGLNFTVDDGAGHTGIISFTVISVYDDWANGDFENEFTNPAPGADFDGDGLTNLQEFAFGTDPTAGSPGSITYQPGGSVTHTGLPVASNLAAGEGVDFHAIFGRRKDHDIIGLHYTVQFSADLQNWVNNETLPTLLTGETSNGDIEAVSVPYPMSIPAEGGSQKPTFLRVGVSQP